MRVWLPLLVVCSCAKAQEPSGASKGNEVENRPKVVALDAGVIKGGGAFASLTGTTDFLSSGGVSVTKVDTHDQDDAKRLIAVMEKDIALLQPCLNDRRLTKLWPPEVEFSLDASGRASSFALPQGQEVPCLTQWIEGLDLGSPKGGKSVKVKVVLLVARE